LKWLYARSRLGKAPRKRIRLRKWKRIWGGKAARKRLCPWERIYPWKARKRIRLRERIRLRQRWIDHRKVSWRSDNRVYQRLRQRWIDHRKVSWRSDNRVHHWEIPRWVIYKRFFWFKYRLVCGGFPGLYIRSCKRVVCR